MRYAKRTDDNHRDVVDEFRLVMPEATVFDSSGAGNGFPDLVIGLKGRNYLFEIKDPEKCPSARGLTDAQKEFHIGWQGQVTVVHSAAEICATLARINTP